MARRIAVAFVLVGLVCVPVSGAGCSSTSSSPGAANSGPNACINDASVKLIQASDYDQSCTVDTDCQEISEGNACVPCAFGCPLGGAINVSALPKYMSDVANTPAVGSECPAIPCIAAVFPCCIGGKCQLGSRSLCSNPTPADAAADTGADGASDAPADSCAPSGCTGSCLSGRHNVSTMVNGCVVWDCCVPDDAGADAGGE